MAEHLRRTRVAELLRARESQLAAVRATISPRVMVKQLHFIGQQATHAADLTHSWTNPEAQVGVPLKITGTVIVLPSGAGAAGAPAIVDVDPTLQIVRWVRVADGRVLCVDQLHYVPLIGDIGSPIRVDVYVRVAGASIGSRESEAEIIRSSVAVASVATQAVGLTRADLRQTIEHLRNKKPCAFDLVDWPQKNAPAPRSSPLKRGRPSAMIVLTRDKFKFQLNGKTAEKLPYGAEVELSEIADHANKARVRLGKRSEFVVTFGSSRSRTNAIIAFAAFSGRARNAEIALSAADAKGVLSTMGEVAQRTLVDSLLAIDGELSFKRARAGAAAAPALEPVDAHATVWQRDRDGPRPSAAELATALGELRALARDLGETVFPTSAIELISRVLPSLEASVAVAAPVAASVAALVAAPVVGAEDADSDWPATPTKKAPCAADDSTAKAGADDSDGWADDATARGALPTAARGVVDSSDEDDDFNGTRDDTEGVYGRSNFPGAFHCRILFEEDLQGLFLGTTAEVRLEDEGADIDAESRARSNSTNKNFTTTTIAVPPRFIPDRNEEAISVEKLTIHIARFQYIWLFFINYF